MLYVNVSNYYFRIETSFNIQHTKNNIQNNFTVKALPFTHGTFFTANSFIDSYQKIIF